MDPETNDNGDDWGDDDSWDQGDPGSHGDDSGAGAHDSGDHDHQRAWEDADEDDRWNEDGPYDDGQDLAGVHAPDEPMEFKRRLEAAPVEAAPIQWKLWGPVLVAIALAAGAAAAWAVLSADNNRGDLQVISTQELLTPECTWTIAYEMENTTDVPLQAVDTRVVANGLTLYVTQAAPDVVVGPNSTFTNTIVYGLPDCPATAEDIDHGPLEVFYANSEGRGETLAADF